ncbi:hypothetical protein KCU71_g5876, partial [Aureobasidium melanogenum]
MFLPTSLIPSPIRSHFYAPRSLASLWSGLAAFSSTRHAAITRLAREQGSEEARAAEAQRREYKREWGIAARAKETEEERHERLAQRRQQYASSPELRKKYNEQARKYRLQPAIRAKYTQTARERWLTMRHEEAHRLRQSRDQNLKKRRADTLSAYLNGSRRPSQENWSWPTHTHVHYPDRIYHRCTKCDRTRFLSMWWKEKLPGKHSNTDDASQDRYMCNYCFANSWDLVVPEGNIERLPRLFTSPDYPPPVRSPDTIEAQHQDVAMMKEKKG